MNDSNKMTRIAGGITAIIASVLLIVTANMLIAEFMPVFGESARTKTLVIVPYVIIGVAVLSKLFSVVLIAKKNTNYMAAGVIATQIALIALEITTMVLWAGMGTAIRVIDYVFMAFSVLSIILAVVYIFQQMRSPEKQVYTYEKN